MKLTGPKSLLRIILCVCVFLGSRVQLFAQNDTLPIDEVALTARKSGFSSLGKKIVYVDSATKEQFRFSNVADLLAYNGSIYIKSYGPGGIATTALRGGSAEQTAVLWNGMNLQNTMLGQTDLSLLPSILFESVGIEYGPGSSVWGGGAVGGSLHLGNKARFGKQLRLTGAGSLGTQGQKNIAGVIVAGNSKIVNTTKVYTAGSNNHFKYPDQYSDTVRTMKNAGYSGVGIMNELRVAAGKRHVVSVNAWWNKADRRIASYNLAVPSKQNQHDNALRLQGAWSYHKNNYRTQLRSVFLDEVIEYNDSVFKIFAKNRAKTIMLDNEHYLGWGNANEFYAGVSYMGTSATSGNYDGTQALTRYSLLAGNRFVLPGNKLDFAVNGRAEYFSAATLPVTGNLSFEYRPFKRLKAGANVSTFYRQPTLNELFWSPGGNRNLHPENGEGVDGILSCQTEKRKLSFNVSVSGFARRVRNWILWVPGAGGNPSPQNVQEVWSRGGETSWKLSFVSGKWRAAIQLNTSYVLSTVEKSELKNSAAVGKQLIYTPRYTAGGSLSAGFKRTSVFLLTQYAGYRFTSTDNTSWLDPYYVVSVRATQEVMFSGLSSVLFVSVNNFLNESYAVQAGRPMPLRSFEFGVTIHFNHKTKNENN